MARGRGNGTRCDNKASLLSAIDTAPFLPMSHLPAHSEVLSNPKPHSSHSVDFLHLPLSAQRDRMRNPKSHEVLASGNPDSASVCNARIGTEHKPTQLVRTPHGSSFNTDCNSGSNREKWWVSDMDDYIAASRLCREEAMACSLQAAGVHWPFAERENRRTKINNKSLLLTCRALNAGTNKSWRGLKKLFSKQFMPFSNRHHHGLHHINTTISKRSLKALNVGGRKMEARIQLDANKSEFILGRKKLQGKENMEQKGNAIKEPSSIDVEICYSRLGLSAKDCATLQQGKLKQSGFKKKVRIVLNKASGVALEVFDLLNLE